MNALCIASTAIISERTGLSPFSVGGYEMVCHVPACISRALVRLKRQITAVSSVRRLLEIPDSDRDNNGPMYRLSYLLVSSFGSRNRSPGAA